MTRLNKNQFEGKLNRRNAIIVAVISASTVFIVGIAGLLYQRNSSQTPSTKLNLNSNNGEINYIEGDYNEYHDTVEKQKNNNSNSVVYYKLSCVANSELIKKIEKATNRVRISNNSRNVILIGYTGSLLPLAESKTIYYYTGGHLTISINNFLCYEFFNFTIKAIRSNPKIKIEAEIEKIINQYVAAHTQELSKTIVQCVR